MHLQRHHAACVQVMALPQYYANEYAADSGCMIPSQEYAGHGPPKVDSGVSVTLEAKSGKPATEYEGGATYTLSSSAYGSEPVNIYIHATVGATSRAHPACQLHTPCSARVCANTRPLPNAVQHALTMVPSTSSLAARPIKLAPASLSTAPSMAVTWQCNSLCVLRRHLWCGAWLRRGCRLPGLHLLDSLRERPRRHVGRAGRGEGVRHGVGRAGRQSV
jgi:hypothetical protein